MSADTESFRVPDYISDAFDNVDYQLQITHTVDTDKGVMTFTNSLWGFEITGGVDQFEPLRILRVNRFGLARRAGMRASDVITHINDIPADDLTLMEAKKLISESGKLVRINVQGDTDSESDDEFSVDFTFKPRKPWKRDFVPREFVFPPVEKQKPVYKESNCFLASRLNH